MIEKNIIYLNIEDKIQYVAKLLANYYQFDDKLTTSFYQYILHKIMNKDLSFLEYDNIFQVIQEYKNDSLIIDNLDRIIRPKQYLEVPIRHINKIKELLVNKLYNCPRNRLDELYENEDIYRLSRQTSYLDSESIYLAYKLYLSIGFNHSLELLQDKFGEISFATLYFLFYLIDVKKIDILNKRLVSFLFDNKDNSTMSFILEGKSKELYLNFSYFYENFSYYDKILQGNLSKTRVEELLKDRFLTFEPIFPNVRRDIVLDMISSFSNKFGYQYSDREIKDIHFHFFEDNMSKLISSSIPQIQVEDHGLRASVLAKSDPRILVMGYRANNCFRIHGDASILFSKTVKSKDFRVVSISSSKDNDIAMMLVNRNGNALIAQGIEISKSYQDIENRKKIYQICEEILKSLMQEMNSLGDEIVISVIGCSNSNVANFNSNILPFRISPVFEGDLFQNFYNGFQFPQCLVALKDKANFHDIKLFSPDQEYFDKREEVLCLKPNDYSYVRNLVNQRLISVSYFADTQKRRIRIQSTHVTKEIYCNTDWYLIVFEDGEVDGTYLENDPRAKEEYEFYLSQVKNIIYKK